MNLVVHVNIFPVWWLAPCIGHHRHTHRDPHHREYARLFPNHACAMRAAALGAPQGKSSIHHVARRSTASFTGGVLLPSRGISGETAPRLFTSR